MAPQSKHYMQKAKRTVSFPKIDRTAIQNRIFTKTYMQRHTKIIKSTEIVKRGKRKVQGVPQSQTAALLRHQEGEETDKRLITQSMHQSENIKIKFITIIYKDEYSWLILLYSRVNENNSWTTAGQAKDISSSLNPLVKVFEEAVIESGARTAVVQLKSEA